MGIERHLKVGEKFRFPAAYSGPPGAGVVSIGGFSLQIGKGERSLISVTGGAKIAGIEMAITKADATVAPTRRTSLKGENVEKSHRNYVWLPWILQAVNYVEQQGKDVMSGPFSGCYMIRYKHGGGGWRVAHVDMPGGRDAWNALASEAGFTIGCGFKPFLSAGTGDDVKYDTTFGIITDDGCCWRVIAGGLEGHRLIKQVVKVDSLTPEGLKNLA